MDTNDRLTAIAVIFAGLGLMEFGWFTAAQAELAVGAFYIYLKP